MRAIAAVILGIVAGALLAASLIARGAEYERAYLVRDEPSGDYKYRKCTYNTYRGLSITIIRRGVPCPNFISFNPETGRVIE